MATVLIYRGTVSVGKIASSGRPASSGGAADAEVFSFTPIPAGAYTGEGPGGLGPRTLLTFSNVRAVTVETPGEAAVETFGRERGVADPAHPGAYLTAAQVYQRAQQRAAGYRVISAG
jgi:hypothetical protein